MATNGRKRYFHIDEHASSEKIWFNRWSRECWQGWDNLMNDSDTDFITEEEITQAASTLDSSLTTPQLLFT